ncbi:hypothetical protein [Metabacillus herbersteinensis]|uniref:hypothetical protein n=1 Tax=Metabacillus herbersteinensis TaxID=283816 RepID=UPI00366DEC17
MKKVYRGVNENNGNSTGDFDNGAIGNEQDEPASSCGYFNFQIFVGNRFNLEQRAEGGGQINKDVGTNANQGGQNAINGSKSANIKSEFANGNGRSGIAGKGNDEQGGQQGIKVRDTKLIKSKIKSASEQSN